MNTSIHSHTKTALNDLLAAKRAWSGRCFGAPRASGFRAFAVVAPPAPDQNVVGVGIGEKLDGGKPTGVLAVKFFVRRKFPEGEISRGDMLPKSIDGLPVDVEEAGFLRALATKPRKPRSPANRWHSRRRGCPTQRRNGVRPRLGVPAAFARRATHFAWRALSAQSSATAPVLTS